jgi:hypothetical protein
MNLSRLTPEEIAHPGCSERLLSYLKFDELTPEGLQDIVLDANKEELAFILQVAKRVLKDNAPRDGEGAGEWLNASHVYKRGNNIIAVLCVSLPPPQLNIPPQASMILPDGERVSVPPAYDHANFSLEKTQERAEVMLKERRVI